MKIDAVGVTTTNIAKTVEFYKLIGFEFEDFDPNEDHLEPITKDGAVRLMIDSASEVNEVAKKVEEAGFTVVKQPWDAFWGQCYCIVADPDGYMVDLFANL